MLVFMVLKFCALLDRQPILDEADARGIDEEYAKRTVVSSMKHTPAWGDAKV